MKLAALIALLGVSIADRPAPRTFHHENVLGTSLELKLIGGSEADADHAETAVLNEIDRLNAILSTWTPTSEVSRWTRTHGQPIAVSRELFEVLGLYDQYRKETLGALNASAETATRLWKNGQPATAALETGLTRPVLAWAVAPDNTCAAAQALVLIVRTARSIKAPICRPKPVQLKAANPKQTSPAGSSRRGLWSRLRPACGAPFPDFSAAVAAPAVAVGWPAPPWRCRPAAGSGRG